MKLPHPYKCDYCDAVKGESNHWWNLLTDRTFKVDMRPEALPVQFTRDAVLVPWNPVVADLQGVEHICSESCAAKALSRWMSKTRKAEVGHAESFAG